MEYGKRSIQVSFMVNRNLNELYLGNQANIA